MSVSIQIVQHSNNAKLTDAVKDLVEQGYKITHVTSTGIKGSMSEPEVVVTVFLERRDTGPTEDHDLPPDGGTTQGGQILKFRGRQEFERERLAA